MTNTNLHTAGNGAAGSSGTMVQRLALAPWGSSRGTGLFGDSRHSSRLEIESTISTEFTIHGNIKCVGQAKLDGEVFGNVECLDLVVGENGHIIGDVIADNIVVYGRVQGAVRGRQVSLKSGAVVEGDIYHDNLGIEMGAVFLGKSVRIMEAPQAVNGNGS